MNPETPNNRTGRRPDIVRPTPRDESILRTLLFKARLLSFEQIASVWWKDQARCVEQCEHRLRLLCESYLLEERSAMAEPLLKLVAPICRWEPGQPSPNCDAIAWRLQQRWRNLPTQTRVFIATELAAGLYGGVGGIMPTLGQETHDLHVAAVYLQFCAVRPADAISWMGEEILRPFRDGEKLPDAVLITPERQIHRVIEFGGKYDARRVAAFHHDCCARNLPYELW